MVNNKNPPPPPHGRLQLNPLHHPPRPSKTHHPFAAQCPRLPAPPLIFPVCHHNLSSTKVTYHYVSSLALVSHACSADGIYAPTASTCVLTEEHQRIATNLKVVPSMLDIALMFLEAGIADVARLWPGGRIARACRSLGSIGGPWQVWSWLMMVKSLRGRGSYWWRYCIH